MTELLPPAQAYPLWAPTYPPVAHNPVMMAEERAMLALLPDLRNLHVLDAACGSGRYSDVAREFGAAQVVGVDLVAEMLACGGGSRVRGRLEQLPLQTGWADVVICAMAVGHVQSLTDCLAELARANRSGGTILCSDFHPVGHALGWQRTFRANGTRYAVKHFPHTIGEWRFACESLGLEVTAIKEGWLDLTQIPSGASFDRRALDMPVVLAVKIRKS